jgi:hypothetical protein
VEGGKSISMKVMRSPKLAVAWKQEPLTEALLSRVDFHLAVLARLGWEIEPITRYLTGIAMMAKIDVHFRIERNAFLEFFRALNAAMLELGSVAEGDFPGAFQKLAADFGWAGADHYLTLANTPLPDLGEDDVTLEHVATTKLICDAYFNRRFDEMVSGGLLGPLPGNDAAEP